MRQSSQNQLQELSTESVDIPGTDLRVGRVALGTWAMGGWMWGGTDERESVATIRTALGRGINLIDTAPVYGFGVSEETVGRAVAERANLLLADVRGALGRSARVGERPLAALWALREVPFGDVEEFHREVIHVRSEDLHPL